MSFNSTYTRPAVRLGGLSVLLWECFANPLKNKEGGRLSPNFSGKQSQQPEGKIILNTEQALNEWINKARINKLELPSKSPDLNRNNVNPHQVCQERWLKIQPEACGWLSKAPD